MNEKMMKARKLKTDTKPSTLCLNIETSILDLLLYARGMNFDQAPDYDKLEKNFKSNLLKLGWKPEQGFCWTPPQLEKARSQNLPKPPKGKDDSRKSQNNDGSSIGAAEMPAPAQAFPSKPVLKQPVPVQPVHTSTLPRKDKLSSDPLMDLMLQAATAGQRQQPRVVLNKPLNK